MTLDDPIQRSQAARQPRYCPRCREADVADGPLCPYCGDPLERQGYCAICEDFWLLRVGELCPKHDLELEGHAPAAPPATAAEAGEPTALVTIGTFATPTEAAAARVRLEAEGIPTFLQGERMGHFALHQVATGGVPLQVPRSVAAEARILLSQTWRPPDDADDLDDAWEELAPEPGARRRRVMKALILLFLFGPLLLALLEYVLRAIP